MRASCNGQVAHIDVHSTLPPETIRLRVTTAPIGSTC